MPKKDLLALQAKWRHRVLAPLRQPETGQKKYVLAQFPYPSGLLHMGHARVYTMADALARRYALQGHPVRHPMGWDAFGLPAENAAREHRVDPAAWTAGNIQQMRDQMDSLGLAFDWGLQVDTSSCAYHQWSQHLFRRLFQAGLAYKAEAPVNWDPVDQTVLAEEQVDKQGRSWRSGAVVEKRTLSQWFIRITAYADRLVDDLDTLTGWPESVKQMQREWIGRQVGLESVFYCGDASVKLFLSRPLECVDKILVPCQHHLALRGVCKVQSDLGGASAIPVVVDQGVADATVVYKADCRAGPSALADLGRPLQKRYKLHDWLISRQRKWGTPIPVLYCPVHGTVLDGGCQSCSDTRHEQDTMDTFVDSSWYYLRFCDPHNERRMVDPEAARRWMPVDVYVGGVEHAVLHLLYARFMHKFIKDDQRLDIPDEPFQRLICQGLVMGRTFKCPDTGRYLKRSEYRLVQNSKTPVAVLSDGHRVAEAEWEKMSKSKFNGVDPIGLVERFGADAVRLSILFKAPPEFPLYWDEGDVVGQHRWLLRLLQLYAEWTASSYRPDGLVSEEDAGLLVALDAAIAQVSKDLSAEKAHFHTAIAALMKLSNRMAECRELCRSATFKTALECLAVMLHPMAPFCSSELYAMVCPGVAVDEAQWPAPIDPPGGTAKIATIAVQLDGRTVGRVQCPMDCSQEEVQAAIARSTRQVLPRDPKRIVFIPNRVLNYCS